MATETEASGLHGFISDVDALLAESEALLASMDAAPTASVVVPQRVAPLPVDGETENDQCGDGLKTDVAPRDAGVSKKKRSRNSTRDREKAEIELLRVQATALAKEVTALQSEKTPVSQALTSVWRRLAERQVQGEQKAEDENKDLRAEVGENARTLRRLRETLVARLKQQRSGHVLRNEQRRCMEWIDTVVFARLKAELVDAYARTDDVIRESGVHSMLEDGVEYSHSRKLHWKDEQQRYASELVSVRLLPFEAHKASDAMWQISSTQFFRCCFHSTDPCNQLSSCSGYLVGEKQQNDIMAIKFQQTARVDGVDVVFDARQVMQRYKEDARYVHIWIAEYGMTGQAAADTKNMGWVIWKRASVSYSSASIVGSISLSNVANLAEQYGDPDCRTHNVIDSIIPSNEVCTDELSMMVENMLLQPQRNVDES